MRSPETRAAALLLAMLLPPVHLACRHRGLADDGPFLTFRCEQDCEDARQACLEGADRVRDDFGEAVGTCERRSKSCRAGCQPE